MADCCEEDLVLDSLAVCCAPLSALASALSGATKPRLQRTADGRNVHRDADRGGTALGTEAAAAEGAVQAGAMGGVAAEGVTMVADGTGVQGGGGHVAVHEHKQELGDTAAAAGSPAPAATAAADASPATTGADGSAGLGADACLAPGCASLQLVGGPFRAAVLVKKPHSTSMMQLCMYAGGLASLVFHTPPLQQQQQQQQPAVKVEGPQAREAPAPGASLPGQQQAATDGQAPTAPGSQPPSAQDSTTTAAGGGGGGKGGPSLGTGAAPAEVHGLQWPQLRTRLLALPGAMPPREPVQSGGTGLAQGQAAGPGAAKGASGPAEGTSTDLTRRAGMEQQQQQMVWLLTEAIEPAVRLALSHLASL